MRDCLDHVWPGNTLVPMRDCLGHIGLGTRMSRWGIAWVIMAWEHACEGFCFFPNWFLVHPDVGSSILWSGFWMYKVEKVRGQLSCIYFLSALDSQAPAAVTSQQWSVVTWNFKPNQPLLYVRIFYHSDRNGTRIVTDLRMDPGSGFRVSICREGRHWWVWTTCQVSYIQYGR